MVYLDMLQTWLMPQQDACPCHYDNDVRGYLNQHLPHRWIGRTGQENKVLMKWPPRSTYLTPYDFYLCGFVKDNVYVPPFPVNLQEPLHQRSCRGYDKP
ncbi:hypothetical protein C0J52_01042 [Blattella germanica]|nr:hypothetical protein C0J52_01042 [Blattella germanica]